MSVLVRTQAVPEHVIVDPVRHMPRLWSTAWSLGLTSSSQATSTRKLYLQHLDSFIGTVTNASVPAFYRRGYEHSGR